MDYYDLIEKHENKKNAQREADDELIRSGKALPIDIARKNSIFVGVDLHRKKNGKGFD